MDTKRILLVEDNPNDEILTLAALKAAKTTEQIDVVRDGEEALDFLFRREQFANRDKNQMPLFIVLDLKLPKIDGLDVIKEIRANEATKRIPVVILTSSREEGDLMAGYDNGANSYVVKPIDSTKFKKAIEYIGSYWFNLNATPKQ